MPYNKGTLDAYRKILCRELGVATGSGTHSGSAWVSGSLIVYGNITGTSFAGPISTSTHAGSHYSGSTDAISIDASQITSGSLPLSSYPTGSMTINASQVVSGQFTVAQNILASALVTDIQNHSPLAHGGGHTSGSGDSVTIFKNQISDINDLSFVAPQLSITGSGISSISGSLIITGSISGSDYYGPAMHVQTGSATIYGRRIINFTDAGGMIISMTDDGANDRITLALQASGSGGGSLANSVVGSHVYSQVDTYGVAADGSRSDHVHGTPGLYETAAADIASAGVIGTNASGSHGDHVHRGVLSVINSGSSAIYGTICITGSTPNILSTQSGQVIQIALAAKLTGLTDITATNITGSTTLSGANILGPTATITYINTTNITGSVISGSSYLGSSADFTNIIASTISGSSILSGANIYGSSAFITNITSTNVTGSTSISGSSIYGKDAVITNIIADYITGSTLISGSFKGPDAIITNITATNITGSTLVSGSTFRGPTAFVTNVMATNVSGSALLSGASIIGSNATITNILATNITGSGTISGSTIFAGTLQANTFNPTNIGATNVTGSSIVSGSIVYAGTVFSGSKIIVTGNISGSSISGSIPVDARANTGTTFKRHRLNFVQGANMTIVAADDSANDEIDVTFTAGTGIGTYYGFLTISAFETSGSVTHGIGTTPPAGRICIMPTDDLGGRYYWISQTGSTTFALTMSSADFSDHIIGWSYN